MLRHSGRKRLNRQPQTPLGQGRKVKERENENFQTNSRVKRIFTLRRIEHTTAYLKRAIELPDAVLRCLYQELTLPNAKAQGPENFHSDGYDIMKLLTIVDYAAAQCMLVQV